jgi:CRP-like cAMP-binding protein
MSKSAENQLLLKLPKEIREHLLGHATRVDIGVMQVLQKKDVVIENVYFPEDCILSLVVSMADERTVEVATVGKEGVLGLSVFWGADLLPILAIGEVPGKALRLPAKVFQEAIVKYPELNLALQHYTQALFVLVTQVLACNTLHSIEERCVRWILMTHDRVHQETVPLTQEVLAQMLGVRRPTVTLAAGMLRKAGLIEYNRGSVKILDREGLESATCSCYGIIRKEFDRLQGQSVLDV